MNKKRYFSIIFITSVIVWGCLSKEKRVKVIFFGDSITYNGLIWKHGFINKIDSIIKSEDLEYKYQLEGSGNIGNKVTDLYSRLQKDVIQYNPDIVVIYIGINDVNNGKPDIESEEFKKVYCSIIKELNKKKIKSIICTPTVIGELPNLKNPKDLYLEKYTTILNDISIQYSIPLCNLRKAFTGYLNVNNSTSKLNGVLTADGIHLNRKGNLIVAENMWKIIKSVKL